MFEPPSACLTQMIENGHTKIINKKVLKRLNSYSNGSFNEVPGGTRETLTNLLLAKNIKQWNRAPRH